MTRKKPALTRLQVEQSLGCGRATLERLVAAGRLRPAKRVGRAHVYAPAAVEALRLKLEAERRGREGTMAARERKDLALAILTELRIERERGALVPREAAEDAVAVWQSSVRAALLRLPSAAAQRGLPREHEALLRGLIADVLNTLAHRTGGQVDAAKVEEH